MAKGQVGIQLYTLRDETAKDFLGTLKKVADIGYKVVEFAGYFETPAKQLKQVLNDNGLTSASAHVGLNFHEPDKLLSDLAKQVEYAQELGLRYVVCPGAPFPERPELADIQRLADQLGQAGKLVSEAGLKFGYHNHDFEFRLIDGKPAIDHLFELVPAEFLIAEFDLGWIQVAGYNPVEYVQRYAGRVPLAHFKDFGEGRQDTEVGKGSVDFDGVLKIADEAGIEYYIVEQEQFPVSSLESAKICLDFFKERGLA